MELNISAKKQAPGFAVGQRHGRPKIACGLTGACLPTVRSCCHALQTSVTLARSKRISLFSSARTSSNHKKSTMDKQQLLQQSDDPMSCSTCHRHASVSHDMDVRVCPKDHTLASPADPSIADKSAFLEDWVMAGDHETSQCHAVMDQAAGAAEALPPEPALPPKPRPPAKTPLSCLTMNIDWLQGATQQS